MVETDDHAQGDGLRDTDCDLGGVGNSDDRADEPTQFVSRDNTRLRTALPPTVLITELDDGTLIIQGGPDGLRVRLSPSDVGPLRWELAAAVERAEVERARD